MTAPRTKSPGRRRRLTVAGLLGSVALIAMGLGGYRHAEPWLAARRVHPKMAPLSALLTHSPDSFRCSACHSIFQNLTPRWRGRN